MIVLVFNMLVHVSINLKFNRAIITVTLRTYAVVHFLSDESLLQNDADNDKNKINLLERRLNVPNQTTLSF